MVKRSKLILKKSTRRKAGTLESKIVVFMKVTINYLIPGTDTL